jgi:hypothetical protein
MGMGWLGTRHYETLVVGYRGHKSLHRPHNIRRAATFTRFRDYFLKFFRFIDDKGAKNDLLVTVLLPRSNETDKAHLGQPGKGSANYGWNLKTMYDLPFSFDAQVRLALGTSIFVVYEQRVPESVIFLPTDSVLIVIGTTIDWDIWNNMGHIRVHWLKSDLSLVTLILQEVGRLRSTAPFWSGEGSAELPFAGSSTITVHKVEGPPPPGQVHCIGENFESNKFRKTWFRSCRYENMCLDLRTNNFTLYDGRSFSVLNDTLHLSSWPTEVTMAQPQDLYKGSTRRWKPVIQRDKFPEFHYRLSDNIVWVLYEDWDLCHIGK